MTTNYVQPVDEERTNGIDHLTDESLIGYLETADGDLIVGADSDVLKANVIESVSQRLIAFIHTRKGTVAIWPEFGSRVQDLFGKASSNAAVFEQAKADLLQDLRSNGFTPIAEETEVLPYSSSVIIIRVTLQITTADVAQSTIEQTYQLQSDEALIEFLGGRSY
jgi:hypothetical protein